MNSLEHGVRLHVLTCTRFSLPIVPVHRFLSANSSRLIKGDRCWYTGHCFTKRGAVRQANTQMQRIFKQLQDDAKKLATESNADVEIIVKYSFRAQPQVPANSPRQSASKSKEDWYFFSQVP